MAKVQPSLTGRVSNTNLGTEKRGKFVLELGEDNKPIRTSNIRVVAEVGTKFPTSISAERIAVLATMRSDLNLVSTDYVLIKQDEFEADDDKGLEAQDFAIYRPVAPEVTF